MIPALNPALPRIRQKIFWWFCIVLWCGLIFNMSNQNADESSNLSLCVADFLNRCLRQLFGTGVPAISEDVVRKCAHFFEYFVLGCLLFMGFLDRARSVRAVLVMFAAGLLFAVSDEVHQLFIPGRTMRPFDVLVDMAGIGAAVLVMRQMILRRPPRNPSDAKNER
ncbi:MAG: VanZ family protein [Chitinispirillaceae bacterium]|nr:VanZ family protein [Chitinispirillaceae bacterium]